MRRETNPCAREVFHGQANFRYLRPDVAHTLATRKSEISQRGCRILRGSYLWVSRRTEVRRRELSPIIDVALSAASDVTSPARASRAPLHRILSRQVRLPGQLHPGPAALKNTYFAGTELRDFSK